MAQQESSNDLPVIVGAVVVGLIAIGIFFFMRKDPVLAPAAPEPVRGPVNAQAVAPRMMDTKVDPVGPAGGSLGSGGTGGVAGTGGGGPVSAGLSQAGGG